MDKIGGGNDMGIKLRLIFKAGISDYDGKLCEYKYATDLIELPDNAAAFQLPGNKEKWLPEIIGGEWIFEKD